jgi:uncharacterized protein YcsI (UPF0317 family)
MTLRTAETAAGARACIRSGEYAGPTSGLAPGFAQANLVVLPVEYALDFLRFCVRNPKPCPLLEVTDTGSPHPIMLASDADIRTDLPRYRVFRDGQLVDEPTDITRYWRADLVAFLLGCSFTFEWALSAAGLPLAHQAQGVNVPMFVTTRACVGAGPFEGPLVVSMRPFAPHDIPRAVEVSARFPAMHGAPVHVGDPAELGITDVNRPDFGDRVRSAAADVPVFWACGVTPQAVALQARPSLAIFHAPGHMFITDRPHVDFDCQDEGRDHP